MFPCQIHTEININAPIERVWDTLVDFEAYPDWNPFVRTVRGELKEGDYLHIMAFPPGRPPMRFRTYVEGISRPRELRWGGKFLLSSAFTAEHYFVLEPKGENKTKFLHGELFWGWLVPVFTFSFMRASRRGFVAMNFALKARVEGGME